MSKRFTDTQKWKDPWFRALICKHKSFWQYICDDCDNAGIWKIDMELAQVFIGEKIDLNEAVEAFNIGKKRVILMDGKLRIVDFITFQFGQLNPDCKPHKSILDLLQKHGIKGYPKGIHTLQEKDKDKERDKDIGGVGDKIRESWFEEIWAKYPVKDGKKDALRHFMASVKTEQGFKRINQALQNYLSIDRVKNNFIKNGSTWFNNWTDFVEYREPRKGDISRESEEVKKQKWKDLGLSECHGKTIEQMEDGSYRCACNQEQSWYKPPKIELKTI